MLLNLQWQEYLNKSKYCIVQAYTTLSVKKIIKNTILQLFKLKSYSILYIDKMMVCYKGELVWQKSQF